MEENGSGVSTESRERLRRIEDGQFGLGVKLDEFIASRAPIHVEFEGRVTRLETEMESLDMLAEKIDLIVQSQLSILTQLTSHEALHRANSVSLDTHIARSEAIQRHVELLEISLEPLKKTHEFTLNSLKFAKWAAGVLITAGTFAFWIWDRFYTK